MLLAKRTARRIRLELSSAELLQALQRGFALRRVRAAAISEIHGVLWQAALGTSSNTAEFEHRPQYRRGVIRMSICTAIIVPSIHRRRVYHAPPCMHRHYEAGRRNADGIIHVHALVLAVPTRVCLDGIIISRTNIETRGLRTKSCHHACCHARTRFIVISPARQPSTHSKSNGTFCPGHPTKRSTFTHTACRHAHCVVRQG